MYSRSNEFTGFLKLFSTLHHCSVYLYLFTHYYCVTRDLKALWWRHWRKGLNVSIVHVWLDFLGFHWNRKWKLHWPATISRSHILILFQATAYGTLIFKTNFKMSKDKSTTQCHHRPLKPRTLSHIKRSGMDTIQNSEVFSMDPDFTNTNLIGSSV